MLSIVIFLFFIVPPIRLVAKLTCGGLARLFVTNKDKNFDSSVAYNPQFLSLFAAKIHRNSARLFIPQQVYPGCGRSRKTATPRSPQTNLL
jgi:hypothetical protein